MRPAWIDARRAWSRQDGMDAAQALARRLQGAGTRVLASLIDNSVAWAVLDQACRMAGVVHVPLPLFFTPDQVGHALSLTGAQSLVCPVPMARRWPEAPIDAVVVAEEPLAHVWLPRTAAPPVLPPGTAKVTFTSGTTGTPKGVCLGEAGLQVVARSVAQTLGPLGVHRHLCALPLAVLLEDVAGLQAAWAAEATAIVLPLAELGWQGSSSFDVARFHAAVTVHAPDSLILLPQMLAAWAAYLGARQQRAPASLRFVAVGGAPVGAELIARARLLGLPVYEGYGLSEGGSVQTLNHPGADRPGSVGRPLPHARVRVAADGELEVSGALMLGYLGGAEAALPPGAWWPTGDLGEIDDQGFVHVRGRKKNVLITAYGRNVSPEWVETRLRAQPGIAQAVVFGDGQPALGAVLWPMAADLDDTPLRRAVEAVNATLPDYAQLRHWTRACAPLNDTSGLATANGRPRRDAILAAHPHLFPTEELLS